jgi:hypothetical protein
VNDHSAATRRLSQVNARPIELGAGGDVRWAPLGDFNEDGHLDAFVAQPSIDTVRLMLGNGEGGFTAQSGIRIGPAGSVPYESALGDMNGDGHLDSVVANRTGGDVFVMLGDGHGGLTTRPSITVSEDDRDAVRYVKVGDLDKDGDLDAVLTAPRNSELVVRLADGEGGWTEQRHFDIGVETFDVELGDLNRDGNIDAFVSRNWDQNVQVMLGDGRGNFAPGQVMHQEQPAVMALGDFDGPTTPDGLPILGPGIPITADLDWLA